MDLAASLTAIVLGVWAMEDACGVAIDQGPIRELRRLLYCGEWIESHSLHVYLLHAPDFLGYPGFVEMARDHPRLAEQGLQMKKAGNALMALVGGREVHPINVRVGGFYRAPTPASCALCSIPWSRPARSRWRRCAGHRG
jgi:sulfhydrogenase subunit alpha